MRQPSKNNRCHYNQNHYIQGANFQNAFPFIPILHDRQVAFATTIFIMRKPPPDFFTHIPKHLQFMMLTQMFSPIRPSPLWNQIGSFAQTNNIPEIIKFLQQFNIDLNTLKSQFFQRPDINPGDTFSFKLADIL